MNFFEAQDSARKKTALLVLLFALAVLALVTLTNLLVMLAFGYVDSSINMAQGQWLDMLQLPDWHVFLMIGAGVSAIVVLGSLYKISALSAGGSRVAEMLDAELIVDGSGDLNRQKILNVVEEMAIASGTPVPPVYLLDEDGINAFAAGYRSGDAVIGITRGAIEKLSRDQLQGVIAHEFSHIFNGDMRLNIRLIGVLHGILVIGLIGYYIMRSTRVTRIRSSKNNKAGGIIMLGAGLLVIGYAGTFFGNIIKAAVSRQREYLADSSAVQFTRNPDGIAGALKRIGGDAHGSTLDNADAAQISHMLFGQGIKPFFNSLFATHPPLEKRIRAIAPGWNGEFDYSSEQDKLTPEAEAAPDKGKSAQEIFTQVITTAAVLEQIGNPQAAHVQQAQALLAGLPGIIKQSAHEPHGARAVIYALLISKDRDTREKQLAHLNEHADSGVYDEVEKLLVWENSITIDSRLPLIDMTLAALRQLSDKQYRLFKYNLTALIKMDAKISLFEWALQKILKHHLAPRFEKTPGRNTRLYLTQTRSECELLLSFMVHACVQENLTALEVFALAQNALGLAGLNLHDKAALKLDELDTAIDRLNQLKPLQKPALLKACAIAITSDETITAQEHELLRAIADSLDCPMPPLLQP